MKKLFAVRSHSTDMDLVLLLLRLFTGYAFIIHSWFKVQNPFGWMGEGAPIPGFLQGLATLAEFGGGIVLILGLVTRLGALGLTITMAVASSMHLFMMKDPLVHLTGGRSAELAAVYFLIALTFLVFGPGRFSLDRKIFGAKN